MTVSDFLSLLVLLVTDNNDGVTDILVGGGLGRGEVVGLHLNTQNSCFGGDEDAQGSSGLLRKSKHSNVPGNAEKKKKKRN